MRSFIAPIHKDGWIFGALFAFVTLILYKMSTILGHLGLVATVWCLYFFRNPMRYVPHKEGVIVSPADGIVCLVQEVTPPEALGLGSEPLTRISVFLNIFNVHINRIPIAGTIIKKIYHPGKFLNASLDKASEENERCSLVVKTASGHHIGFVQIAGLIARRIRCNVREGDTVATGETYGLIRFGSRADIYLPAGFSAQVCVGPNHGGRRNHFG